MRSFEDRARSGEAASREIRGDDPALRRPPGVEPFRLRAVREVREQAARLRPGDRRSAFVVCDGREAPQHAGDRGRAERARDPGRVQPACVEPPRRGRADPRRDLVSGDARGRAVRGRPLRTPRRRRAQPGRRTRSGGRPTRRACRRSRAHARACRSPARRAAPARRSRVRRRWPRARRPTPAPRRRPDALRRSRPPRARRRACPAQWRLAAWIVSAGSESKRRSVLKAASVSDAVTLGIVPEGPRRICCASRRKGGVMEVGLSVGGPLELIGEVARHCEEAGYNTLWVAETSRTAFLQAAVALQATTDHDDRYLDRARVPALAGGHRDGGARPRRAVRWAVHARARHAGEAGQRAPLRDPVRASRCRRCARSIEICRKVWRAYAGEPIDHRGRFYTVTMPPFPGGQPAPGPIPVYLAGVNRRMLRADRRGRRRLPRAPVLEPEVLHRDGPSRDRRRAGALGPQDATRFGSSRE